MTGTGTPCCDCTPCRCLKGSVDFNTVQIQLSTVVIPPHATVTGLAYRVHYHASLWPLAFLSQDADFFYYTLQMPNYAAGVRLSKADGFPPRVVFFGGHVAGPVVPTIDTSHFEGIGSEIGGLWECAGGAYSLLEHNDYSDPQYKWEYDRMLISGIDQLMGGSPDLRFPLEVSCCSQDEGFPEYLLDTDVPLSATIGIGPFEGYGADCENCDFNNIAGEFEVTGLFADIIDQTTHWQLTYGLTVQDTPIVGTDQVISLVAFHPKTADYNAHYRLHIEYDGADESPLCNNQDGFAKWTAWFFHDTCHFGGQATTESTGTEVVLDTGGALVTIASCPPPDVNNIFGSIAFP
jgi:hypothetical protein